MKARIMIADDDPGILDAVCIMLEDAGYEVDMMSDGESVKAMEKVPDLLLLDIWMSGVNGGEVCRYLRERNDTKNLPVIMVSANKDTEQIATESGADDFVTKPFDIDVLLNKIDTLLKKRAS
jgi:DNA-binding response OmpR family regulator